MESASTPAYVTPTASETVLAPANEPYGKIVVIKRSGQDSASFELVDAVYTFGRAPNCDIRIQLQCIAEEHCKIVRNEHGQAFITNMADVGTVINGVRMNEASAVLKHGDIVTIVERSFRYEYTPEMEARVQMASSHAAMESPLIPLAQETPRKASSLGMSVFSVSELKSSPATPRTPVLPVDATAPANPSVTRVASTEQTPSRSPHMVPSPLGSAVVDAEITASPRLSPRVVRIDTESVSSGRPLSLLSSNETNAGDNPFCDASHDETEANVVTMEEARIERDDTEVPLVSIVAVAEGIAVKETFVEDSVTDIVTEKMSTEDTVVEEAAAAVNVMEENFVEEEAVTGETAVKETFAEMASEGNVDAPEMAAVAVTDAVIEAPEAESSSTAERASESAKHAVGSESAVPASVDAVALAEDVQMVELAQDTPTASAEERQTPVVLVRPEVVLVRSELVSSSESSELKVAESVAQANATAETAVEMDSETSTVQAVVEEESIITASLDTSNASVPMTKEASGQVAEATCDIEPGSIEDNALVSGSSEFASTDAVMNETESLKNADSAAETIMTELTLTEVALTGEPTVEAVPASESGLDETAPVVETLDVSKANGVDELQSESDGAGVADIVVPVVETMGDACATEQNVSVDCEVAVSESMDVEMNGTAMELAEDAPQAAMEDVQLAMEDVVQVAPEDIVQIALEDAPQMTPEEAPQLALEDVVPTTSEDTVQIASEDVQPVSKDVQPASEDAPTTSEDVQPVSEDVQPVSEDAPQVTSEAQIVMPEETAVNDVDEHVEEEVSSVGTVSKPATPFSAQKRQHVETEHSSTPHSQSVRKSTRTPASTTGRTTRATRKSDASTETEESSLAMTTRSTGKRQLRSSASFSANKAARTRARDTDEEEETETPGSPSTKSRSASSASRSVASDSALDSKQPALDENAKTQSNEATNSGRKNAGVADTAVTPIRRSLRSRVMDK